MADLLDRTTAYFVNRVAPMLLGRHVDVDSARRADLDRQALNELRARIGRGRPGPEEWRLGAPATMAMPPQIRMSPAIRPVAVQVCWPPPVPHRPDVLAPAAKA